MNKIIRPSWEVYFINIANLVSTRSTCLRRQYGAVIVDPNHTIVSTGYNGAPSNTRSCLDSSVCVRDSLGIPSGMNYELCKSVHAEMNAIIRSRSSVIGCDLYIGSTNIKDDREPCDMCKRIMVNAGIKRCIYVAGDTIISAIVKDAYGFSWDSEGV